MTFDYIGPKGNFIKFDFFSCNEKCFGKVSEDYNKLEARLQTVQCM